MKNIINKLVSPAIISLGDQFLLSGTNFLTGILIARLSGLPAFGSYSLLALYLLFPLGIQQAFVISPMQKNGASLLPAKLSGYLKQLLFIQFLYSFISAVAVGMVFSQSDNQNIISPINAALFVFASLTYETARKMAYLLHTKQGIIGGSLIGNLLPFVIFFINPLFEINLFIQLQAIAYLLALVSVLPVLRVPVSYRLYILLKLHARHSSWLVATSLLQWFSGNLFLLWGGSLLGMGSLGALRMAQNMMGLLNVVLLSLENHLPLELATLLRNRNTETFRMVFKQFYTKYATAGFFLLLLLFVASPYLIQFFYGTGLIKYTFVLRGFIIVYLFVIAGTPLRITLRVASRQQYIFAGYLLSAVFSLLFAHLLINRFQLAGVLAGFGISQLILFGTYLYGLKSINLFKKSMAVPACVE